MMLIICQDDNVTYHHMNDCEALSWMLFDFIISWTFWNIKKSDLHNYAILGDWPVIRFTHLCITSIPKCMKSQPCHWQHQETVAKQLCIIVSKLSIPISNNILVTPSFRLYTKKSLIVCV